MFDSQVGLISKDRRCWAPPRRRLAGSGRCAQRNAHPRWHAIGRNQNRRRKHSLDGLAAFARPNRVERRFQLQQAAEKVGLTGSGVSFGVMIDRHDRARRRAAAERGLVSISVSIATGTLPHSQLKPKVGGVRLQANAGRSGRRKDPACVRRTVDQAVDKSQFKPKRRRSSLN